MQLSCYAAGHAVLVLPFKVTCNAYQSPYHSKDDVHCKEKFLYSLIIKITFFLISRFPSIRNSGSFLYLVFYFEFLENQIIFLLPVLFIHIRHFYISKDLFCQFILFLTFLRFFLRLFSNPMIYCHLPKPPGPDTS